MAKILQHNEIGLLLFIRHGDDDTPPWPDAPGYAGCADSFVETCDLFECRRCIGTLRLYVREPFPSPAFVLGEVAEELTINHTEWLGFIDPAEACRIRFEAPQTVWLAAEQPISLTQDEEARLRSQAVSYWDDIRDSIEDGS